MPRLSGVATPLRAAGEPGQRVDEGAVGGGLDLLAAASAEARAGAEIGLNWVGSGGPFTDRSTFEATTGTGSAGGGFGRDAFLWASLRYGTDPDIGVGEAWRALELAGKLGNRVDVAILAWASSRATTSPPTTSRSPTCPSSRRSGPRTCSGAVAARSARGTDRWRRARRWRSRTTASAVPDRAARWRGPCSCSPRTTSSPRSPPSGRRASSGRASPT